MKIFAQELKDGLGDILSETGSIAYTANVICDQKSHDDMEVDFSKLIEENNLSLASSNPDQVDLFYLQSVLVSTGWNKNDDVFEPEEVWAARKTPEDKQFNYMHDEADIIGHITSNRAVDFENTYLPDDLTQIPKDFNIITNAVIYTSWSNPIQQERINKLIAEIKENKWYVSMECIFPSFDYALLNSQGGINIIKREESSAFLTKHLRVYGGAGEYEGHKVGRVLRNLVFSGKGLVNQPANPRSVILNNKEETIAKIQETKEMSDNQEFTVALQSELVDVKAELKNALAKIEELNVVATKVEELTSEVASLTAEKEAAEAKLTEVKSSVELKTQELEDAVAENKKLSTSVASLEKDVKTQARKGELTEAGLTGDKLEETLAKFDSLDDEQFSSIVKVIAESMKKDDKKSDKKPDDKKGDKKEEEESYSSDLDTVETDETASASVTETEDNDEEDLRSTASEWFAATLKSNRDTK